MDKKSQKKYEKVLKIDKRDEKIRGMDSGKFLNNNKRVKWTG